MRFAVVPLLLVTCALPVPLDAVRAPHRAASLSRTSSVAAQQPAPSNSSTADIDVAALARIDELIEQGIRDRKLPGAVVLVGHGDRVVYRKAYGKRAVAPRIEPMTVDTIFDVASLTKVVATTTSVMILVEEARLRLSDRVASHIPEFGKYGKEAITLRHLLTHVSGLRPDVDLADEWSGYDTAIRLAAEEVPLARPGERFVYSDINFFVLAEVVRRTSGMPMERFAESRIFQPLGMRDTMFHPPERLRPRIAPTERCTPLGWPCDGPGAEILRGVVHDPTARRMGGAAGHAGVFSTADDLATFCRMLLNGGALGNVRILSPLGVARMTRPSTPAGEPNVRGLGWDIDSAFSSNRGELFPPGSFGHTGWTGTSLWLDPASKTFLVFLSNRVHPDGKGDVTPLRARVATMVAAAIRNVDPHRVATAWPAGARLPPSGSVAAPTPEPVLGGIDVLQAEGFSRLRGKRVALFTNHTGRNRAGESTIDLLHRAPDVRLVALFSPEHGIRGDLDEKVPSGRDEKTGLPVHSLYGNTPASRRPTAEQLRGVDVIVLDVQDIGARFYTYAWATAYVMEEAARHGIDVMVLDRVNPVNGFSIEGPALEPELAGYEGHAGVPVRHGLTLGEMARFVNAEKKLGAKLTVVEMKGWRRDQWFDETGLPWINPSPNMRNMIQAALYPGIGAIEWSNISVGRGTDTPFEQIGAPWIDGVVLARELNARNLPGIRFYPVSFTPSAREYAGEPCNGVFMLVLDRQVLQPVRVGVEIASVLNRLYGTQYELERTARLLGSRDIIARIRAGEDPATIAASWAADEARWRLKRAKYLLYF